MAPDQISSPGPASSGADLDSQQWAIQRRIDDVFAKLGEKFGDLTGRVVVQIKPNTTFAQIGGLREAKSIVRSFATALTEPELYRKWGITPPKGVLLYGPPGTGKSLVAPGRLDRLVEVTLPDGADQQEILEMARKRAESNAGRPLFADIDYRSVLPPMGGMSGAELSEIIRRALEQKVHAAGQGHDTG